jgi:diguanylate cyclase (GGDEF)-like protein
MDAAPGTDMVVGLLYREAKSNELLLSTVRVLRTPERVTGVFAIDSYTQAIAEQLTRRSSFFATSYSFIADSRWEIIVHPDPGFVGVDARTVAGGFAAVDDGEFVEYRLEGNPKLAYVSRVPLTGWYLVTTVDEADITGPTFRDLAFYLGFILLIVTGFGIVNATVWGRRYMDPLLALRDRVREIVRSGSSTTAAVFPDNEVGEIATTVESMAGDALISKNRELEAANAQITRMNAELALKNSELEVLATHDYLTGVFNRRKIEQALAVEHSKFERYGTPYSMMIIDLDHFKTVNDEYGHREGDDVLIRLGEAFRGRLRKSDMLGRWGGEEFMVLLANTTLPDAAEAAEKMRIVAAELDLGLPRNVTISVGVGEVKAGESSDGFIRRVDTLLYEAKERGRDRVISG